jgi:hypothetical protein
MSKIGALRELLVSLLQEHERDDVVKRDRRYKDGHPHEVVETEALSQTVLVNILRCRLNALLPEPLSRVQERAERQRRRVTAELRRA